MKVSSRKSLGSLILTVVLILSLASVTPTSALMLWQVVGAENFSAGGAQYTSLKIDSNGMPYVAYQDNASTYKATVMKFNGVNWENVGSAGFSDAGAQYTSLALYNDTPYVAYQDNSDSENKVTVMKYTGAGGTGWELVGSARFSAGQADYVSLAIDSSGTPYVAYKDGGNSNKAMVMKYTGAGSTGWEPVEATPGLSADAVNYVSLAINSADTLYVAYQDGLLGRGFSTTVKKFNGANWEIVGAEGFSVEPSYYISLAIDSSDVPHVAYKGANTGIQVMKYTGAGAYSGWEKIGSAGFAGEYTSLAMDNNTPYVAYQDYDNDYKATTMKFNGSTWETVGSAGFSTDAPYSTSLAIYSGIPYIAYWGADSGHVTVMKYADAPEMDLFQDTTAITDGGSYDFGDLAVGTNTDAVFTIQNNGTANLTFTTPITLSGDNADQFSIQAQPTSPVLSTGSATFTVRFTPTSVGVKTATISILNNDADENPYDLTVTGGICINNAIVTSAADDGSDGTLRWAISAVCDGSTITFDNDYTITLASQLPVITKTLTITGNGAANTIIQANANPGVADYRVFEVDSAGNLTLDSLSVKNGQCNGACATSGTRGGGVYNLGTLTVKNSAFSGNSASYGGAIRNSGTGTLTVSNSVFYDNNADSGGGIYNNNILTVTNSTFSANGANAGGGIYTSSEDGDCSSEPAAVISNSTFSGNSADSGGGIFNSNGVISLLFNTITASPSGGGVSSYNDDFTCTKASGNIIAGNTGVDVSAEDTIQRFASSGYNLIGTAGDNVDFTQEFNQTGDQVNVADPKLGALGNYGGSTETLPLLHDSSAIDAGDTACAAAPISGKDQRGVARPSGACDIGAFESQGFTLGSLTGTPQSATINTAFSDPLGLTVTANDSGVPVTGLVVTFSVPDTGASAVLSGSPVTVNADGAASVNATANGTAGSYNVTASATGATSVNFSLTNNPSCSSAITVVNLNDGGAGSLRQAIGDVCAGGKITFDPSLAGQTITLTSGQLSINKNLTIDGSALTTPITIANAPHTFNISNAVVTLDSLVIDKGVTGDYGGGMYNYQGTVTIKNCTFSNNGAGFEGGAIYNNQGTLTVLNSTFYNNQRGSGGSGGAISNNGGTLTVINSTFSGNGNSTGFASAIGSNYGTLIVTNSTFRDNSGDGTIISDNGPLTITNTIIANSAGRNCLGSSTVSGSNNLADDNTCGTGFTESDSILLGTLGNYGGQTETLPLLPGSAAIDAGDAPTCPTTDQRGESRFGACDIGAFESQGFTLTKTASGDNQSTLISTAFTNPLEVTVSSSYSEPVEGGQVTFTPNGTTANASITGSPATIGSDGKASVTATANDTVGSYTVTASASGATSADFALTNLDNHIVSYDANNATSGTVPADQIKIAGVDLTLATNTGKLARTGYALIGWNTRPDGAGIHYALGGTYSADTSVTLYAEWKTLQTLRFRSNGINDGMVRESSETSGLGGYNTFTSQMISIGDDSLKRQYVGILDFDTSSLPEGVVITGAVVRVKVMFLSNGVYTRLGNLIADITRPFFGGLVTLQNSDFQARANRVKVGAFSKATGTNQWITLRVNTSGLTAVNLSGHTQFRLRFTLDDSNDILKDQIGLLSGNYSVLADRPLLTITYYVP